MIADYTREGRSLYLDSPRQYALAQQHKHLKEMRHIAGLKEFPIFCPIVADFYSGMEVTVPLFRRQLQNGAGPDDIRAVYEQKYKGPILSYRETLEEGGFLASNLLAGKDSMAVSVSGNEERILLTAVYDNLGKGASGAAIQNMNLTLGVDETCGLEI